MLKRFYFALERAVGKVKGHRKIEVTDLSGRKFIRRVSHKNIQDLITDPKVRSVRFLN